MVSMVIVDILEYSLKYGLAGEFGSQAAGESLADEAYDGIS